MGGVIKSCVLAAAAADWPPAELKAFEKLPRLRKGKRGAQSPF